jgi:hypothetical protein
VPTDLPIRPRTSIASAAKLVTLISFLPWLACLLLAHALPAVAPAFALVGQIS